MVVVGLVLVVDELVVVVLVDVLVEVLVEVVVVVVVEVVGVDVVVGGSGVTNVQIIVNSVIVV